MKKAITSLAFLLFGFGGIYAQESPVAAGGDVSGTGGSVAYSVGQVVYTNNTGSNGSTAQGVQQPFEISEVLGVKEQSELQIDLVAYPNPTNKNLTLNVQGDKYSTLNFELFDVQGKMLINKEMNGNTTIIGMEHLPKATYILKVNKNGLSIKTFKVIKN